MSLEEQAKSILNNYDDTSSEKILEVLKMINTLFKNELTIDYLRGKLEKIVVLDDETEKKKQCKALLPYLDWYLQGL